MYIYFNTFLANGVVKDNRSKVTYCCSLMVMKKRVYLLLIFFQTQYTPRKAFVDATSHFTVVKMLCG